MINHWVHVKLGNIIEVKHGFAFQSKYFSKLGSYILLTPGNFFEKGGFKLINGKEKFYNGPIPQEYVLSKDDLIVVMTEQAEGLHGSSAVVPESNRYLHNQRLGLVKPQDGSEIDLRYFYYLFNSSSVRKQIRATASGVKVRHTSPSRIYEVKVKIPQFSVQQHIASILSTYDDLIENNTRRIKILEEMAKLIYHEWFVEFKAPGAKLRKATAEEKKVTGKDQFPDGWEVKNLFEVSEVIYGFPLNSKYFTNDPIGKPVIRIRNLKTYVSDTFTSETLSEKYLIKNGDLLAGMDGDFHFVKWAGGEAYQNQRIVKFRPKNNISRYYLYHCLVKPIKFFDETVVGTTVAHLSDEDLRTINIILPSKKILEQINEVLNPLFDLEVNLISKNQNLRRTRDLLLPKLVSGEIEV